MVLNDANIAGLKAILQKALMDEWKAQGHFMDGKVVEDINYEVSATLNGVQIVGKMYAYGGYINEGVQASNIPFSPGSGATHSRYIEGLIGYVQKRMAINDLRTAKSVAFAIAHTQKREGMPTGGSYKYTRTGKRTEWVNDALRKNMDKIGNYIRQFYAQYMRTKFQELIVTYSKTV